MQKRPKTAVQSAKLLMVARSRASVWKRDSGAQIPQHFRQSHAKTWWGPDGSDESYFCGCYGQLVVTANALASTQQLLRSSQPCEKQRQKTTHSSEGFSCSPSGPSVSGFSTAFRGLSEERCCPLSWELGLNQTMSHSGHAELEVK